LTYGMVPVSVQNAVGERLLPAGESDHRDGGEGILVLASTTFLPVCRRPVARVVAGSTGPSCSVGVTSHHRLLAQRKESVFRQPLGWQPVCADELVNGDNLLHMQDVGQPCEILPVPVLQSATSSCNTGAVAIETDQPDAAFWIFSEAAGEAAWTAALDVGRMTGCIAIFGEAPPVPVAERNVSIWSCSRHPAEFREALADSPYLELCRRNLRLAGYAPELEVEEGGLFNGLFKIFVTPQDARLIQHNLRERVLQLRPSDVVVGTEYEECVRTVIALLPNRLKVRIQTVRRLDLRDRLRVKNTFLEENPISTGGRVRARTI